MKILYLLLSIAILSLVYLLYSSYQNKLNIKNRQIVRGLSEAILDKISKYIYNENNEIFDIESLDFAIEKYIIEKKVDIILSMELELLVNLDINQLKEKNKHFFYKSKDGQYEIIQPKLIKDYYFILNKENIILVMWDKGDNYTILPKKLPLKFNSEIVGVCTVYYNHCFLLPLYPYNLSIEIILILLLLIIIHFIIIKELFIIKIQQKDRIHSKQNKLSQENRLSTINEIASTVAHEINNPLAVIIASIENINYNFKKNNQEKLNQDQLYLKQDRTYLSIQKALEKSRYMAIKIRYILDYAKIEEDKAVEYIDIKKSIIDVIETFFAHSIKNNNIHLKKDFPNCKIKVMINIHRFEQLLHNLIDNSLNSLNKKAMIINSKFEKKIWIRIKVHKNIEQDSHYLILEVEDNGIGMDPKVQENCFKLFFTSNNSKKGLGIGLSIVNRIVKNYNMKLWIDSKEEGVIFKIKIPSEITIVE